MIDKDLIAKALYALDGYDPMGLVPVEELVNGINANGEDRRFRWQAYFERSMRVVEELDSLRNRADVKG